VLDDESAAEHKVALRSATKKETLLMRAQGGTADSQLRAQLLAGSQELPIFLLLLLLLLTF
jgi:hypothetical protein